MLIGRKRFGYIYIVKMDDLNKALATMSSTKIFVFSVKIKDLSTHGLVFWVSYAVKDSALVCGHTALDLL